MRLRTSFGSAKGALQGVLWIIGYNAIIETRGDERRRDDEPLEDEEKVLAGHPGANMTALLTKDVPGG